MASAPPIDASKYSHSPVHAAVLARDYAALRRELASLPRLSDPSSILTEPASLAEESKADAISAAVDRRDVPGRETPLHLAVRLSDPTSAEILMSAGADWSLQNDLGWSALQEAVSARDEALARVIVRRYQPLAWAKWCRRLPRVVAVMRRMRDFYMEISFHFESSVVPFISRVAPSDTYRIWKRGASLRADMTLAGFDGFRIKRSDQSVLFLGEGSEDGEVPPGALCILSHKSKEVMNALEGAGNLPTEREIQQEVSSMLKTSILRPGIDVTKAVLLPQMTWRRQERKDTIGPWKTKVYDMHNVVVSVRSRQVPGSPAKGKVESSGNESAIDADEFADVLTAEEMKQLEAALKMDCSDTGLSLKMDCSDTVGYVGQRHSSYERRDILAENTTCPGDNVVDQDKGKGGEKQKRDGKKKTGQTRSSLSVDGMVSDLLGESPPHLQSRTAKGEDLKGGDDRDSKKSGASSENGSRKNGDGKDSEYKKGLRPVLWLSPNFPLQTDELLPLLDILANKVKAIRRLRELLTTKLPPGTFPVKVAIPVVPTIRVLVTFTKFEELQPSEEFLTPPSSPEQKSPKLQPSNSWRHWMKGTSHGNYPPRPGATPGATSCLENIQEPFVIPPDYAWITPEVKKKRMADKRRKASKSKSQNKRSTDNVH